MKDILFKHKYLIMAGLGFFVVITFYYFSSSGNGTSNELEINEAILEIEDITHHSTQADAVVVPSEEIVLSPLFVDIKGAVVTPGVYELQKGSRVKDALEKAGGVNPEADVKFVNLAALLIDEMVIYVPKIGEEISEQYETLAVSSKESDGLISINKATIEELQTLPGIGPSKANAIIEHREQIGGFKNIDELLSIPGIGPKTLDKLRDKINIK